MKRFTKTRLVRALVLLCLTVTATTLAAPATAGAARSTASSVIRVTGSGIRAPSSSTDVPFTFSFDARTLSPPNGINGTFSGSFPHDPFAPCCQAPGDFASFSGTVTCLAVKGDTATIGGILTSGYGYDGFYDSPPHKLAGDWFILQAQDPPGAAPDTIGYIDWGSRAYFLSAGYGYSSFDSMCDDPQADLGTNQFPLSSGDIQIAS
jgi:hypothetical protein